MTLIQSRAVSLSSSDFVKMEERKRPASHDHHDDSAPPSKKQATSINGGTKTHVDADMPWQDDLEVSLGSVKLLRRNIPFNVFFFTQQKRLALTKTHVIALSKGSYMATNARI